MKRPRLRSGWGTAGLVAFLVCDVVLIGAAFAHVRGGDAGNGAAPVRTADAPSTGSVTDAASGSKTTGTGSPTTTSGPGGSARLTIVAVDDTHAWRFSTGSCADGGATLEVTTDAGKSWEARVAPFGATTRVRVRPDGSAFGVGGEPDKDCAPRIRQSGDQATSWGSASKVTDAWYRDLRDPSRIGTASGSTAKPCGSADVLDLAVPDDKAVVLCADGRVTESSNGDTWKSQGTVKGGLALASSGQQTVVVRDGGQACDGLAVVDVATTDQVAGCVEGVDEVTAAEVGLSVADKTWWLRVGDKTWRSSGGPAEWRAS